MRRRVVITGMGVIAPNGQDLGKFWESIRTGKSAAAPLTRFPLGDAPVRIACEIKNFVPSLYMEPKLTQGAAVGPIVTFKCMNGIAEYLQ